MRQPDADGKYPLTMREYDALRTVFGALNALDSDTLKERLKTTKYGWRDIRLCLAVMRKVLDKLLLTIPPLKLLTLQEELKHTYCEVRIRGGGTPSHPDCVYVSQKAIVAMIDRAIQLECLLCDKSVKDGKRCPLYKNIQALFPYELDEPTDTKCPFAGVSHVNYGKDD